MTNMESIGVLGGRKFGKFRSGEEWICKKEVSLVFVLVIRSFECKRINL